MIRAVGWVRGLTGILACFALGWSMPASATLDQYEVKLFDSTKAVIGIGGFLFDNAGASGTAGSASFNITGGTQAGASFSSSSTLEALVRTVDYADDTRAVSPTTPPQGPERVDGLFVEGLSGSVDGLCKNPFNDQFTVDCRISFALATPGTDPRAFQKTFEVRNKANLSAPAILTGTYSVRNTVPEPGTLALVVGGLGVAGVFSRRRRAPSSRPERHAEQP